MSRHLQTLFLLAVLSFLFVIPTQAQVTTASMSGTVMFQDEPVIGATVLAVHEPSGTNYGTITNVDGRFSLQGMRTGGPYKVTISYVGYQSAVYSGITLQLGENYNLNVKLKESSETLDEIVITAAKTKFNTEKRVRQQISPRHRSPLYPPLTVVSPISHAFLLMPPT